MPDTLREKIAIEFAVHDGFDELMPSHFEAADRILAIPELQEALELYEACHSALRTHREFTIARELTLGTTPNLGHSISTNTKSVE